MKVFRYLKKVVFRSRAGVRSGGRTPPRYDMLYDVFERETKRKRTILEIGSYKGDTAVALIKIALRHEPSDTIHYYGFDLFDRLDDETLAREISMRPTRSMEEVRRFICGETGIPAEQVHLYQGFTRDTLWAKLTELPRMGFIFIDGGHSDETVENDWRACRELMDGDTVVVFDDFYHFERGPRQLIAGLDRTRYAVQILEPQDVFPDRFGVSPDGVLKINMVKVTLK